MRLVLQYTAGDGFTYSAEITLPIEYESAEALAVDFEEACKKAIHHRDDRGWRVTEFTLAGHQFDAENFFFRSSQGDGMQYYEPKIMTIDEWFAS